MACPVKTQKVSPYARELAAKIEADLGPALFKTDPVTGYRGGAQIVTEIIGAMLERQTGDKYMTDTALGSIVTACTSA
jgi:hypothetical protein